jgi:transcriptional regulator with XRE-family HTH domain
MGNYHTASGRLVNRTRYKPVYTMGSMGARPKHKPPKQILWESVLSLMRQEFGRENLTKLVGKAKIGPGTASRIKNRDTSVGLDVLEKVASAFGVQPWQLLFPAEDQQKFLEICRAWEQATESQREMFAITAKALLQHATDADRPRGAVPSRSG